MMKNDDGVAGWSFCSRTPHDETVLGGRAQLGPSQLRREKDRSMRPSPGRSESRRARGGWVRTVAILTILRDEMLSFRSGSLSPTRPLHFKIGSSCCLLKRGTA